MTFPNIFTKEVTDQVVNRINQINNDTQPEWGKMNAAQMLAHCSVIYETVYTDKHPKPNAFFKFVLKLLAKNGVVGPKPYPKNSRTAPHFIIADERDFKKEQDQLINYIQKTQ